MKKVTPADLIDIRIPNLNKQSCMKEYLVQLCKDQFKFSKALVIDRKFLSSKEMKEFGNNFLIDRNWLKGKGGIASLANLREVNSFSEYTEDEKKEYRNGSYRLVVEVFTLMGETLYIDPEGTSYARYVGFPVVEHFGRYPDYPAIERNLERRFAFKVMCNLKAKGFKSVLAGGCVRDLLKGMEPKDYDICTNAKPEEVEAIFKKTLPLGKAFGVIVVLGEGDERVEVASLRGDGAYKDGRHPEEVNFVSSFQEDAGRRDFTINSMFMNIDGEVEDFYGGQDDLNTGVIRAVGSASDRIKEDKLRMLRAIRFASRFGFSIEDSLLQAIIDNHEDINMVSRERVIKEIQEILTSPNPVLGLDLLMQTGLMKALLPEICLLDTELGDQDCCYHPEGNTWVHTKLVLNELKKQDANFLLMFAGLLHDIGKPATQKRLEGGKITNNNHAQVGAKIAEEICHRFKLSSNDTFRVCELVRLHMRMHLVRDMRQGKLAELLEREDIYYLIMLQHADVMGSERPGREASSHRDFLLSKIDELKEVIKEPPIISGDELIELGFEPGSKFRPILIETLRAQREGSFNDIATARAWVLNVFGDWDGTFPIPKLQSKGGNL